ncbi:MAG: LssY C-terminal domain-containing protein [Pirellulales bacterium]
MTTTLPTRLWHLFITPYTPQPDARAFVEQLQTQEDSRAKVSVAVLDAHQSDRLFGVPLTRRGIQAVYLKIENRSAGMLRLQLVKIDPNYFTPLEAAAANHFSIARRLTAFGLVGWLFFLPLLLLVPLKLITAYRANRRMDDYFRSQALRLRPIEPGEIRQGIVFTALDAGTKVVHVLLEATRDTLDRGAGAPAAAVADAVEFTFSIAVPGITADYLRRDFSALEAREPVECDVPALVDRLSGMPATTANSADTKHGDPVNLVVIGSFETILAAFAARWDESESITLATCWKTLKAFLLGTHYRYSPVSPLYLFGRSQDVALQRTRRSINDRLHLRLWLTPLRFQNQPVWVGQVSRDIGVRFTIKTWNLTTHRIDPDVDESRDYVVEDLMQAQHVDATGYVAGVGECDAASPRHNLTGDSYFTDGLRAAILLSGTRTQPRFVAWSQTGSGVGAAST